MKMLQKQKFQNYKTYIKSTNLLITDKPRSIDPSDELNKTKYINVPLKLLIIVEGNRVDKIPRDSHYQRDNQRDYCYVL